MPEPTTDSRQPGGSGAGSTVSNRGYWISQASLDAAAEREVQLRAALEAAQREIAKAQDAYERMADDRDGWRRQYAQLRAMEAEMRAKIEEARREGLKRAIAALNAAEQPARAETAPRVRSANASVSDDRPDLGTTEEG